MSPEPSAEMQAVFSMAGISKSGPQYKDKILPADDTFATHALTSGVDAKTLSGILGHTNASFTLDTYTHVTPDMQQEASHIVGGCLEDLLGRDLKPWQKNRPEGGRCHG